MVTLGLSVGSKVLGLVLSHENTDKLESRRCLQCGMQHLLTHNQGSINRFLRGRRPNHDTQCLNNEQ